jgi:hypothetical protein
MTELRRLLKRRLIAGLIVIAPLGVTLGVLWWLFTRLDGILGNLLEVILGFRIPGLGLVVLVLILIGVGWLAEWAVGSRILEWWHAALDRVPLVSRLYGATRRIVGSVFGGKEQKTVRLARHSSEPCGTFSVKRRLIPIESARMGRWIMQVDQKRNYSPEPDPVWVRRPIDVTQVFP